MLIKREVGEKISADFFKGKIIVLVGARQVGKTTLMKSLIPAADEVAEFVGDNPTDRARLEDQDFVQLAKMIGGRRFIFIDEAQKIANIGQTLKLLVDNYQAQKQIIATGSSSLNLLANTQEPLTGRKFVYELFGLSSREILPDLNPLAFEKILPELLIFGAYPEVFLSGGQDKQRLLTEITGSYLYQDILELEQIKNPAKLQKILAALALQIGSLVSLTELGATVNLDTKTVERYLDLLEKNFVIFRLPPYYTNQRKTISKQNKVYFCDLGVRNALINNFNPLNLRGDVGALWENFVIGERLKYRKANFIDANQYFWRTYDGAEIDLVEQRQGKLLGYEIKWRQAKASPRTWLEYPEAEYQLINQKNFLDFIKG